MSWQDDCQAAGGFATVFPYAVPLAQIFPEIDATILGALPGSVTVPGFPACRSTDSSGGLQYTIPSGLSTLDKVAIVRDTLGDEAMAQLAGPMQAISNAASAITTPLKWGVALGVGAVLVFLYFNARKKR